jgi:hypothetical protein
MGASLLIFLAGGWLILAPFALGYQPYGADWVNQTTADFATGIPVLRQVKPLHHARRCYALWLWKS